MIQLFQNFRPQVISFWIGILIASIFWWLLRATKPCWIKVSKGIKTRFKTIRKRQQVNTEEQHRTDILKYSQSLHLATSLFSLDEILIPPRLIHPPPLVDPDLPPVYEPIVNTQIPFTPDWPEMATAYQTNSMGIFEFLQNGVNIAITGKPGIGKTTALAYIATKLARKDPETNNLKDYIPFFIHVSNLTLPIEHEQDPIDILLTAISFTNSTLTFPKLSEMMLKTFQTGQAMLLIDGLDELPPEELIQSVIYLGILLEKYPNIHVVVAASEQHIDKLPKIGFIPVPMMTWNQHTQEKFLKQWSDSWMKHIAPIIQESSNVQIEPLIINGWLKNLDPTTTPLEFTLKVWAVYAGDLLGPTIIDSLNAYISRSIPQKPKAQTALRLIASQLILNMKNAVNEFQIQQWVSKGVIENSESQLSSEDQNINNDFGNLKRFPSRIFPELINSGLMIQRVNGRFSFCHPMILGYMGGITLGIKGFRAIQSQPSWAIKSIASTFIASKVDLNSHIETMLDRDDDLLFQNLMETSRWIPNMPPEFASRKTILVQLTHNLKNDKLPIGIRFRTLTALILSRDPGIPLLLRHLLNSKSETTRRLAIIGCGYLKDSQSVSGIIKRLTDSTRNSQAACISLVNIGTKPALEAVTKVLLQGDEMLRRAAAESFASHPLEGHPILLEGSQLNDLIVRRAVIYGLRRVKQPWAQQILEKLQIEENQWIVKDAAAQAVSDLKKPNPLIPGHLPTLFDLPWLIAFAGDRKSGISKENDARDMLLRVLTEGNDDEILAALGQIQRRGETQVFPAIYQILYSKKPELSEAACFTIWQIASMGNEIPPPSHQG